MEPGAVYPRHVWRSLSEALTDTPVVILQGARQVGKSTLANQLAADRPAVVVTLDDPGVLAVAESDPSYFVSQAGDGMLVIDEAQRAPGLILPLKAAVDRDRRPGRFLLTGSADLLQVKGVGDSLAGRAETFELQPLSQGELGRRSTPEDFVSWLLAEPVLGEFDPLDTASVVRGGYPEVQTRLPRRARDWFASYAGRLSDHDARELHGGGYADHLRALLAILAAGGQQEIVRARLARDLDIAENTVDAYLRTAATMRLVLTLPSWGRSLRGRVARRPKTSLNDTGFTAALAGFTEAQALSLGGREYYGVLVEQFVTTQLHAQNGWSDQPYRMFHYRETDGLEVDIVLELADGRLVAIEVKSASELTPRAWRNLERFRERFADREVVGVCFHTGSRAWRVRGWLNLLPVTSLWQH